MCYLILTKPSKIAILYLSKTINTKQERIPMASVHRIIDYLTFSSSINKSRRKKLVDYIRRERTYKRLPERDIQVMPLYGWGEGNNPRRDDGEIRAIIKIQDVVFIVFDNLIDGAEDFRHTLIDEDMLRFLGASATSERRSEPTIKKKDGTPFAGFNGGRKRKTLTSEEKARILALRKAGNNVNVIARELHISNRIVSEFVKNS